MINWPIEMIKSEFRRIETYIDNLESELEDREDSQNV